MGLLVDGKWVDQWYDTTSTGGKFVRKDSAFRHWISNADDNPYQPESGRYHLYVSLACPWAHRTLIFRKLKNLEPHISVSVVHHFMGEHGWTFTTDDQGANGDDLLNSEYMYQIYQKADPQYSGRVTVPVLWDKKTNSIVNNESSEIIRMFNSAFNDLTGNTDDYYPEALRQDIDAINTRIYDHVNNGVYKAGFATTQDAYNEAVHALFNELDHLEDRLTTQRYLTGNNITEADWRLFTTLVRFDPVYVGHFKCNLKRIEDYPNLSSYLRDLYQQPGISDTVNMVHIKHHYYGSHGTINPTGVVPEGPELDLTTAHKRHLISN